MTVSIRTFGIMTFNITTFGIMTFSIMKFSIMTSRLIAFSRMKLSITEKSTTMSVVMLSDIHAECCYYKYCHAECS
jgi:hypothetical protein